MRKDKGEAGLSVTRLPEDVVEWRCFVQRYWWSVPLGSGDLPALALVSTTDLATIGVKTNHEPVDGNAEHFEILGVTEAFSEQLALAASGNGLLAPFLKKPKEPDKQLRSAHYIWPLKPCSNRSAEEIS